MTTTYLQAADQQWVDYHMKLTRPNLDMVWDLMHKDLTEPENKVVLAKDDLDNFIEGMVDDDDSYYSIEDPDEYERRSVARGKYYESLRNEFLSYCRKATRDDYVEWYSGFKRSGGKTEYQRDYPFNVSHGWYVLLVDAIKIPTLYGANSVNLIIPSYVTDVGNYDDEELGHNSIYKMHDYSFVGCGAESFADVR